MTTFVSFKALADQMQSDLTKQYREVLPFATVVALTRSAIIARDLLKEDIRRVFDRPTPYAVNAPRAVPASKDRPASAVVLRDFGGTRAEYYLGPEIDSGARRTKRFERILRDKGILPAGKFVVPGRAAVLDQYGNMSAGEIVQILSALQAFGEVGYLANRARRQRTKKALAKHPKRQTKYFVGKDKLTGDPLAIYKVVSKGKVSPVMAFVKPPEYRTRLPFDSLARQHFEGTFPVQLDKALTEFATK